MSILVNPTLKVNVSPASVSLAAYNDVSTRLVQSGTYLESLITVSNAGVSSLNLRSGIISLTGVGNVTITNSGQVITVSGAGVGDYYPNSNPSGYITGIDTSSFALKSDTGQFAPAALTGNFVTTSQTGAYTNTFPTHTQTGNLIVGKNQTGIYSGSFYPLNSNPSGYITGSTGGFLSASQTGILVGKNETGTFITIGQSGQFYAASNPSGYITNSALTNYIQTSQTGSFATTGFVTGVSGALSTRIESTGNYLYGLIQASSAGVSSLNSQSGSITLVGGGNVSVATNGQTITFSGDTGTYANFALKADTGAFVTTAQTGQFAPAALTGNFVTTSQTGASLVGKNQTGIYSGSFYPLNSNPSSYLTGSTGGFVSITQTGIYSGSFYPITSNPAGYITGSTGGFLSASQTGILVGKNETGIYANSFYPLNSNPSNYVISSQTGAYDNTFVSHTESGALTGAFYPRTTNPSNYLTPSDTGIFDNTFISHAESGSFYPRNENPSGYIRNIETGVFADTLSKSIFLESPSNGDRIPMFWTSKQVTVKRINSVVYTTGEAPSISYRLTQSSSRTGVSGVVLSDVTETNQSTGTLYSSFTNSIISGGGYLFVECSGVTNVANFTLTIEY
jgi:hypothetical protein